MDKSKKLIGVGVAVAAIAAAGTYFLTGRRGARNRAKIEAWTLDMKGELLSKMRKLKEVNREAYYDLVDELAERYEKAEKIGKEEIKRIIPELKSAWAHISKEIKKN